MSEGVRKETRERIERAQSHQGRQANISKETAHWLLSLIPQIQVQATAEDALQQVHSVQRAQRELIAVLERG